ncbi:DNA translocase FtsK 4TM domain-containing protein [Rhodovulum sp. P5]|uniref:DNA translocase FtsK n=1 Tax=Rhodovulum sp. P5 TaxID=1564506 RepID=UPI0020A2748A|nr:DNA translocase FtsK 4TM domain-containing protein [Rhodovulum sp. P5]
MRGREPLLDSEMQAMIERRGKELLGFALLGLAFFIGLVLVSYVPEDPSWFSATEGPSENVLGRFGASIAAPLIIIIGWGAWGFVVLPAVWGLRLVTHIGADRALGRLVMAPIVIALASVYAASHVPPPGWGQTFGMGGLFGDTVLGALLGILPVDTLLGLRIVAGLVWLATLALGLFTLGFDRAELRNFGRYMLLGVVLSYVGLRHIAGRTARGAVEGRKRMGEARQAAAEPRMHRAEPAVTAPEDFVIEETPPRALPGLLARVANIARRTPDPDPAPELVETACDVDDSALAPMSEERIKARIADVIRKRTPEGHAPLRTEPPVVRGAAPLVVPPAPGEALPEDTFTGDFDDMDDFDAPDPIEVTRGPVLPKAEPRQVVQHPPRKSVQPSRRAREEAQPALQFDDQGAQYEHPPLSLLTNPDQIERLYLSDEALSENARMLENVLDDYGVKGEIVSVRPGPVVTMYELEPAPGLKASRVIGLADDIARSMSALSARVSTVPGRSVIGIELPNTNREMVVLREILSSRDFGDSKMRLPLALGKDIGGEPVVANLAKMPHLLIAGTTGSGKSVAINTMILSLLYKLTPDECRLIMIDPKMLELSVYDGIPHLLSPVVTDPKKAVVALKWVVGEMEERYRKMSKMGVRNIEGYNGRVRDALSKDEMFRRTVQTGFDDETGEPVYETEEFLPETLPYIVVIVDEMADLMMVAGKEIEACIQRLAQMARASGIHLIMATQRPSVDVITGTIKANFPTRISFQVTGKIDSRTILGEQGAEQLLGMGDMLYMAGGGRIARVHGPFVSDEEVEEIVNYLKAYGPPDYVGGVVEGPDEDKESDIDLVLGLGGNTNGEDALYDQAVAIVIKDRKCSTSYIQRKLAIGYNKAARLVEQMEDEGVVSPANHVGKREILVPEQA